MGVPRLNVPLELETPVRESDGMGGFTIVWQRVGTLWGEMKSGGGRTGRAEVGPISVVGWRITVRGARQGDQRRPRPEQRFRMGERLFRIEAVAEADPEGRWLTCFAQEEDLG